MLVSGVSDLLSLFVCLELVTISSYVLAAFKRNDLASTEAGLKYLVVGAVSSALLLLGIALLILGIFIWRHCRQRLRIREDLGLSPHLMKKRD